MNPPAQLSVGETEVRELQARKLELQQEKEAVREELRDLRESKAALSAEYVGLKAQVNMLSLCAAWENAMTAREHRLKHCSGKQTWMRSKPMLTSASALSCWPP